MANIVTGFEFWWVNQTGMFASAVDAMYSFCEETSCCSNDLYEEYYNGD